MILTTQLGIIAMGIIFAVGGILYAVNYDFNYIYLDMYNIGISIIRIFQNAIGCYTHTNSTWVGVCS